MYLVDACFGAKQLDSSIPCWRLNHTFVFIEMRNHLCPCVIEVGLGDYKWCEVSSVMTKEDTSVE